MLWHRDGLDDTYFFEKPNSGIFLGASAKVMQQCNETNGEKKGFLLVVTQVLYLCAFTVDSHNIISEKIKLLLLTEVC